MSTLQPGRQGLYDPAHEHDSCGVGFVVDLKNRKSHDIVHKAMHHPQQPRTPRCVRLRGKHRRRRGHPRADAAPLSRASRSETLGFELPEPGEYGVGMVFLPQNAAARKRCEKMLEKDRARRGADSPRLAHRPDRTISRSARAPRRDEPVMRQIFIRKVSGLPADRPDDPLGFERKLYIIRKLAESAAKHSSIPKKEMFYIPSLSCTHTDLQGHA